MNLIILHLSENNDEMMRWIYAAGCVEKEPGRYYLESKHHPYSFLYIFKEKNILTEYDNNELQQLHSLIKTPVPYIIEWGG